jgi:hypothetical protein
VKLSGGGTTREVGRTSVETMIAVVLTPTAVVQHSHIVARADGSR